MAQIVSGLETASGYEIISEGVDMADFSAFLNNGYVTDYAMTLLDYDVDWNNQELIQMCIRDSPEICQILFFMINRKSE